MGVKQIMMTASAASVIRVKQMLNLSLVPTFLALAAFQDTF